MDIIDGGTERKARRDGRVVFDPQQGQRIWSMLSVITCGSPAVPFAVPFASGHGDGTPFLALLLVLVVLVYCLMRVVLKAVTKDPSGDPIKVPHKPSAPPRFR